MTVHITMSNREKVDQDLQSIQVSNRTHYQYILFHKIPLETKMCSLYVNNINNVPVKYEFINNASILDQVKYNSKTGILRDILLDIKHNHSSLFIRVE